MSNFLYRFFDLKALSTTIKGEVIAGITTFSTMAYVIFLNPQILSQTGMDFDSCMVATILASTFGCLCMGLLANYPFALAPSMGLNAYFTFGIVMSENIPWQTGLGACFIAGCIFLLLTLSNIRSYILNAIPLSLRIGTIGGIGIFLALIGMKNGGLVVSDPNTLLKLGNINQPEVFLNLIGISAIATLLSLNVRGAILFGIILNWLIGIASGLIVWQGFFSLPPSLFPTLGQFAIMEAFQPKMIPVVLSLIFVAIFDTAGTLLGLAGQGGYLDEKGRLPRTKKVLYSDSLGTMAGAAFGTSPLAIYLESASGIAAGGKSGLTAVVVGILFSFSLFLSPLATSIPHFATSPALIVIGSMMMMQVKELNWADPTEYVPAFLILIAIPLSFSIATGIAIGFMIYPIIKLFSGKAYDLSWIVWIISALFTLKFIYG
ncbi:hypothetical protein PHSC3_001408 [Chlamydiales bacterium STE3]|nr:hypothetical protein PHSC3_001408 [Chlamydiales bacterium STE3]